MLITTDPTIKLTTGNGPVMTNRTLKLNTHQKEAFIRLDKKILNQKYNLIF